MAGTQAPTSFRVRSSLVRLITGVGLGIVVLLGALLAEIPQRDGPQEIRPLDVWGGLLIVAAVTLTIALLRTAPLLSLVSALLLVDGYLLRGYPYGPVQLCIVVAMYEVARRRPLLRSLPVCGLAAVVASTAVFLRLADDLQFATVLALAWTGWIVVPWLLGALVQTAAANRERGRRHLLAQGAMEERVKIAAEVHDVAGHGFALVAMQAGVALLDFEKKPEQVHRSLQAIQTTSSTSLAALRGMLGTFHADDQLSAPATADHPESPAARTSGRVGLCGLMDLVDQVRAGGVEVWLDLHRLRRSLDPDTDAVAYRVVQESLTNVLRHAGPTAAEVSIEQDGDTTVIVVQDRGRGGPAAADGTARGLAGMRRRVEAIDGEFTAGPRPGGGFRVEARLPVTGESR